MKKMRSSVVTHRGRARLGVDDRIDFVADLQGRPSIQLVDDLLYFFLLSHGGVPRLAVFETWGFHRDLMRPYALDRVVATGHFGNDGVVIAGIEPTAVANLAAGLGVKRCVVEDDFTRFSWLKLLRALTVLDDS